MTAFIVKRLGTIMEPQPGNPMEIEGVLNPAAIRGPDGDLYLFPRLVASGNHSRIGIAKVRFNRDGDPVGVERMGIALEPEADYERGRDGTGGCEDPRITFVAVMTYVALSNVGPRIAIATSKDLFHWERKGLAEFSSYHGIDFDDVDDKDASLFPCAVNGPSGHPELAVLHRPHFRCSGPGDTANSGASRAADLDRKSIWISYLKVPSPGHSLSQPGPFTEHCPLASPARSWERLKIGAGTPPILTPHGWLLVYHGVSKVAKPGSSEMELCYSAGIMVLSSVNPRLVLYRSTDPVLTLEKAEEATGDKSNVVFPTGLDRRDDLGMPDRFDIYFGMGDTRIGAASIHVPKILPAADMVDSIDARL
jgi:predicted GH43/DUF377 family glycosyl hydrolase